MARNKQQKFFNKQQRKQKSQQQQQQQQEQNRSHNHRHHHQQHDLPNHYATLGVEPTATTQEIKSAFRRLAKTYHPDKLDPTATTDRQRAKSAEMFRQANEAYNILVDDDQRRHYDAGFFGQSSEDEFEEDFDDDLHHHHHRRSRRFSDEDSGRGSRATPGSGYYYYCPHGHHFYQQEQQSSFWRFINEHRWKIHLGICVLFAILFTMFMVKIGVVPFIMYIGYEFLAFLFNYLVYYAVYSLAYVALFLGSFYLFHRVLLYKCAWYRNMFGFQVTYSSM